MMTKYTGGCELLAAVDVSELVPWISAILFAEWPKSSSTPGVSMVADLDWHDLGKHSSHVIGPLVDAHWSGVTVYQRMVSIVMSGHEIPPHVDLQDKSWLCRVHVPLITNDQSLFIVGGLPCHLVPGFAYRVNTEAEHSVTNDGKTPRVHLMFDVGRNA